MNNKGKYTRNRVNRVTSSGRPSTYAKHKLLLSGVARGRGGTLREYMIQSIQRFSLAASTPNLSESSLARWATVLVYGALTLGPFGLATRALAAHPPNWIQTNLATRGAPKLLA